MEKDHTKDIDGLSKGLKSSNISTWYGHNDGIANKKNPSREEM